MLDGNPLFLSPLQQLAADIFRAIADPCGAGLAASFDDAVQTADDAFGGQREVDFDTQTFAIEIIRHVQQPECPAVTQAVGHEIHGPSHVRCTWHGHAFKNTPRMSGPAVSMEQAEPHRSNWTSSAGDLPTPMERDPDRPGKVHLPDLRENQPAARAFRTSHR